MTKEGQRKLDEAAMTLNRLGQPRAGQRKFDEAGGMSGGQGRWSETRGPNSMFGFQGEGDFVLNKCNQVIIPKTKSCYKVASAAEHLLCSRRSHNQKLRAHCGASIYATT